MSKFFSIAGIIVNKDNVINISTKLIKHGKKELVDDNGNLFTKEEQYAIVIKQVENQTNTLYYDSKAECDNALQTLIKILVFEKEVVNNVVTESINDHKKL